MKEVIFPPGPNSHNSYVIAGLGCNKLVYGAKTHIVVITLADDGHTSQTIFSAHENRVNGISSCPANVQPALSNTFVSCGDDGFVRCWNAIDLTLLKGHKSHMSQQSPKVSVTATAVSWSTVDPNLVVSGGSNGCLVIWKLAENVTVKHTLLPKSISAIQCSLHDADVVAVAMGGSLHLVKIEKEKINVKKLRVFNSDIVGLQWRPLSDIPLLAVSSQRGEFLVMDTGNKRFVTASLIGKGNKMQQKSPAQVFTSLYPVTWSDNNTIISRSGKDIVSIHVENGFDPAKTETCVPKLVHCLHRRECIALVGFPAKDIVWSFGSDKTGICWNLKRKSQEDSIGFLFGGAICSAISPHDPNLIAFGASDGCVRVWNMSLPTGNAFVEMRNVQDKVMSISWHPTKEEVVFYGTSTGRLGMWEYNKGKAPTLLRSPTTNPIYWLPWGPPFFAPHENKPNQLVMYMVANKTVYVYKDIYSNEAPENFGIQLENPKSTVTDMAWKPDFSMLAVGYKNGAVCLFFPGNVTPCATVYLDGSIQYLTWHPHMTSSDTEISPLNNLLTCGTQSPNGLIRVLKVEREESISFRILAHLEGHNDYVQSVSWNPHVNGQLISASGDTSVQVWNVIEGKAVANYQPLPGSLSWFVTWSPLSPDFIISGFRDAFLRVWKLEPTEIKIPPKLMKVSGKKNKRVNRPCELAEEIVETAKTKREKVCDMAKSVKIPSKLQQPSSLNGWVKSPDFQHILNLLQMNPGKRSEHYLLLLLREDANFDEILEKIAAQMQDKVELLTTMAILGGNLKELIESKIEDGSLTHELVALAPSVSPRLWQEACDAFTKQLLANRRTMEAVHFLVALGRVDEALQVLEENKKFLEAICLLKSQSDVDDDKAKLNSLIRKLGEDLYSKGQLNKAAECYIFLESYAEAAQCMSRCDDSKALRAAGYAARLAKDDKMVTEMALAGLHAAVQSKACHDVVQDIYMENMDIQSARLFYTVYKYINRLVDSSVPLFDLFEVILKDAGIEDRKECFGQFSTARVPSSTSSALPSDWIVYQEICLAALSTEHSTRMRHCLRALEATDNLPRLCSLLSPNLQETGVFAEDNGFGISMRAFLCLALVQKNATDFINEEEILPKVMRLQPCLINSDAKDYYNHLGRLDILNEGIETNGPSKDIELERNKLVLQISKLETNRCVIPHPISAVMKLSAFYKSYESDPNVQLCVENLKMMLPRP